MSTIHRIRLTAIGSEEEMRRLNRIMLMNSGLISEDWPFTLMELYDRVERYALDETGDRQSFVYHMVAPLEYGSALKGSRYTLQQTGRDLWAACFFWDSAEEFQVHDWLKLHNDCGQVPMYAIQAADDFGGTKGEILFEDGQAREDWSRMAPVWMWLIDRYESGLSPEEKVERLRSLERVMAAEEWDQSVEEVLEDCRENLKEIGQDTLVTEQELQSLAEAGNTEELAAARRRLADSILWEGTRLKLYDANLEQTIQAWRERS